MFQISDTVLFDVELDRIKHRRTHTGLSHGRGCASTVKRGEKRPSLQRAVRTLQIPYQCICISDEISPTAALDLTLKTNEAAYLPIVRIV